MHVDFLGSLYLKYWGSACINLHNPPATAHRHRTQNTAACIARWKKKSKGATVIIYYKKNNPLVVVVYRGFSATTTIEKTKQPINSHLMYGADAIA